MKHGLGAGHRQQSPISPTATWIRTVDVHRGPRVLCAEYTVRDIVWGIFHATCHASEDPTILNGIPPTMVLSISICNEP